ncbi:hypothetical protein [Streptomyces leeuwenhoekii]|uniref:Sle1_032 protein n=1 Tax=Streptomyces leeuwenhoekii TaxID=1437453 RepID=A0A0F7VKJ2_STRLW|nr:hypothetical protein [Streptomyces leeuwenhoekii]CQR59199.1 sle1_032 [Streptomyces leeuwenhoekii]
MNRPPATTPADGAEDGTVVEDAAVETMMADAVLTGRNMGAGAYIAGILTGAQAATAPTPQALLKDMWPGVDPAVVQAIYERGVEVGWRGHALYQAPRLSGAELAEAQERLRAAGFEAMRGLVARSRELAGRRLHPADGEAAGGH